MKETTELLKGLVKMAEQYKLTENSSIEQALAQAKSGDTLLLEPGDYVAEKLNLTQINIIVVDAVNLEIISIGITCSQKREDCQ